MLGYTKDIIDIYEKKFNVLKNFKEKNPEERKRFFIEKWSSWLSNYKSRILEEKKDAEQKLDENSYKAKNRKNFMNKVNPAFVLRNYLLENCIKKAENGNYSEIDKLMELIQNPFNEEENKKEYCEKAPSVGTKICVSCSS